MQKIMLVFSVILTVLAPQISSARDQGLHMACVAAKTGMPKGNGSTVYYPNGKILTAYAGQSGATWYYPNGHVLTSYAGEKGSTVYYDNGRVFTSYAGQAGATWYYPNGQILTSSAPEQSLSEMMDTLCDLIEASGATGAGS